MEQLVSVWKALEPRRQVIVVLATLAMFAAVLGLARVASNPSYALLYSGLDSKQSGEVLAALDQTGAAYDVRGSAIYVDAARRDELRMTLAAEGLPSTSGAGYELLDSLSGFGTTSQMFDAAYLRAREGELARTITALPVVRAARVHLADGRKQGLRGTAPASASVVVTTTGAMSTRQVRALRYLVASAVPGLAAEGVSVIDSEGGLIEDAAASTVAGDDERADTLRRNVERLLEARVGYGNAVVEVAVETVNEHEAITERKLDPDSRVAISTDTLENSNSSTDSGNGAVTVASNLPTGNAAAGNGSAQSQSNDTRERTNFEVSETTREVIRAPGAIRRLTVAVLIDGVADPQDPAVKTPRSEEEIAALHDLVAAAVGFDSARGDVITVKSMGFEPAPDALPAPAGSLLERMPFDLMSLIQLAVFAVVSLVLGLFVLRPILTARPQGRPALIAAGAPGDAPEALTGTIDDDGPDPAALPMVPATRQAPDDAADPVARLRQLISDRQDETVEILRGWMEEPEEEKTT
ncbi:flagellar M-ring protein FliF [Defluviimonas denitrificans]|jgi:flagellar M-ring protein FliF|uniref:Flagellar M-ring protein n=1 Tax=Albidovulum denitrificans TaxID=404881 RepID=A0A2S8S8K7_9RHOB|nr:flagellar basal-body MS-ring/collar protein FliF [Defluviimonas denitrificans]PQV57099.1 flagellar M-ring protein FliF [Defluviimonas denitrificans]